jgi:hypothetical protein
VKESVSDKAVRYLVERRLTVTYAKETTVRAKCDGKTGTYVLGHNATRGWWCNCPARTECAHLVALKLLVQAAQK